MASADKHNYTRKALALLALLIPTLVGGPAITVPAPTAIQTVTGIWKIEIVKRSDIAKGFIILLKRWIVERTLAWISRNRCLARDFERYARTVVAFIRLAMIRIMLRRLTKPSPSN
jgi:hypothetical protein